MSNLFTYKIMICVVPIHCCTVTRRPANVMVTVNFKSRNPMYTVLYKLYWENEITKSITNLSIRTVVVVPVYSPMYGLALFFRRIFDS